MGSFHECGINIFLIYVIVIVNSARHAISIKGGFILYCNCPIPYTPCLVEIINSGI